jgi:aryl-alcohol dehydrogenase-like predicted oxidoreductase
MEQLVREGKISYVGSSSFAAWDVALAQCAASARHFMDLTCEQSLYNLAVRTVELELVPALRSLGIGLIPYSPLHAGLLAGILQAAGEGTISDATMRHRIDAHRDQLEAYEVLCRELGAKPAEWRWPGCCGTLSCPPRSSERRLARSCGSISAARRCSWTPRSRNDSTGSGP